VRVVAGLFSTPERADQALLALRLAGLSAERVRSPRVAYIGVPESGLEVPAGMLGGLAVGSLVGAALGSLADMLEWVSLSAASEAAVTTGLLAGLSERVGAPAAAGLGVGALAGSLLGIHAACLFMGELARAYAHQVASGAVMLVVAVPDGVSHAWVRALLRGCGARQLRSGFFSLALDEHHKSPTHR
jgi:hypothetical protein